MLFYAFLLLTQIEKKDFLFLFLNYSFEVGPMCACARPRENDTADILWYNIS